MKGFSLRGSWAALVHVLLSVLLVPLHLLVIVVAIVGLVTIPVLVGIPILGAALVCAHALTELERRRIAALLDIEIPRPERLRGLRVLVRDRTSYRLLGHSVMFTVWNMTASMLYLFVLAVGLALVCLPFALMLLPPAQTEFAGITVDQPWGYIGILVGAGLLLAGLLAARWPAGFAATITTWFTGGGRAIQLRRRITVLEDTRSAMVDAAEAERSRIERNLHDGAQQRLLAVALAVSRARRNLNRDPGKADDLLSEAHDEARAAIEELRDIARSAHPPALTERGLVAALESVARRHPLPVSVEVDLDQRPSRRTETAAYYVVCEGLANVVKHSNAGQSSIRIWREADLLRLTVVDDGCGGATLEPGGGLEGLASRLRALDGTLSVTSPAGGPTVLDGRLPWTT